MFDIFNNNKNIMKCEDCSAICRDTILGNIKRDIKVDQTR